MKLLEFFMGNETRYNMASENNFDTNKWAAAAALSGALSVAMGAFGAHGLEAHFVRFPDLKPIYQTSADYQMYHSLALLAMGLWSRWIKIMLTFWLGMAIFCGSLYLLVFTNIRWLGAITPIGGILLIGAWLALAKCLWRQSS
jgi:uncharacterized membrane protein YgdD (TMEM256/DUF423 family)